MKAAVLKRYGLPSAVRVEEVANPIPGAGEVRIAIRAAPVATADCEVRTFAFQLWLWVPMRLMFGVFAPRSGVRILGQELAGVVDQVGADVTELKAGDEVVVAIEGFGAHAEFRCLPARAAIALKPAHLSFVEASTLSVFALNALHFIRKAELKPGQKILINGAGSSIGTPAVQLAKRAGAEVHAVDSAGKLDMLKAIGADHVIDYRREDFTKSGVVYDVILDVVGKSRYGASLKALKRGGRYILANPKGSSMLRSLWTNRAGEKRVLFAMVGMKADDLRHICALAEAGELRPVVDRTYALDQVAEAHAYVASGEKRGNVVLTIGAV